MARHVSAAGPRDADILFVGEAPGADEELAGTPFVGAAGRELESWLRAAGVDRDAVRVTNVCPFRPPGNDISAWFKPAPKRASASRPSAWSERSGMMFSREVAQGLEELEDELLGWRLARELSASTHGRPGVIVALGNVALWALTVSAAGAGLWGITNWRGSQLVHASTGAALIPMLHPAAVLRQYSWHSLCVHDMKTRVLPSREGPITPPACDASTVQSADEALQWLADCKAGAWLAVDLETARGQIECVGLASGRSPLSARTIPFRCADGPCWTADEQTAIERALIAALDRSLVVGQSTTAYDVAYFDRLLNYPLRTYFDTYIAQSVLWPGEPRDLAHLASLYCDHYRYWKDDAGGWNKQRSAADYTRLYEYCAQDAWRTLEIADKQAERLGQRKLQSQFFECMRYAVDHVYPMGRRGVLRSRERTQAMIAQVDEEAHGCALRIALAAHSTASVNLRSPRQVLALLERVGVRGLSSTSDDALQHAMRNQPEHTDLLNDILRYRQLRALQSNFLSAKVSPDGRLRSQWSATGTETFRLTSGTDQFGTGTNLLNVTKGPPNLRTCIVPDPGWTYFNCDLSRADVWPVVWEADDAELKAALRDGLDLHLLNACTLFGIDDIPRDELRESHPRWAEHCDRYHAERSLAKRFVHLTNYGGKARTCAIACRITVAQAQAAQDRWFRAHPGIKQWHERTAARLRATHSVRNAFGYVRTYFDRIDGVLPQALAYVPQSTVALVAARIHERFDAIEGVEVQMQNYDSVAGQYRTDDEPRILRQMHTAAQSVVVPYANDPFVIPLGLATSTDSWGECKSRAWPAGA